MKKITTTIIAGLCAAALIAGTGCSASVKATSDSSSTSSLVTAVDSPYTATVSSETYTSAVAQMDLEYTKRDQKTDYDEASATKIALSESSATVTGAGAAVEGTTVTISEEGTYILSGDYQGQIKVACDNEDAKVQLVLNGVNIVNENGSAIFIKKADKVFITLPAGTLNALADGANYQTTSEEDTTKAALYSKADLTINGSGELAVVGNYCDGISSNDDLVFVGGTYDVTAKEDAVRGKDCVKIKDGTFNVEAGNDAIKSSNDEELETRGFVVIDGGTFTLTAGDDAIHAETVLAINDGVFNVLGCVEGFEGQKVFLNGGVSHIVASDDGVNASAPGESTADLAQQGGNMQQGQAMQQPTGDNAQNAPQPPNGDMQQPGQGTAPQQGQMPDMQQGQQAMAEGTVAAPGMAAEGCIIEVNGGYVYVVAGSDAFDSNDKIVFNSGISLLSSPTQGDGNAIDYESTAVVNGGVVFATGGTGMNGDLSTSTQAFASAQIQAQAGSLVALTDADGKVLASFTSVQGSSFIQVSAPAMKDGTEYRIVVGGSIEGTNADGYTDDSRNVKISGGTSTTVTAGLQSTAMAGGPGGMGGVMGGMQGGQAMQPPTGDNAQGTQPPQGGTNGQGGQAPQDMPNGQGGQVPQGGPNGQGDQNGQPTAPQGRQQA